MSIVTLFASCKTASRMRDDEKFAVLGNIRGGAIAGYMLESRTYRIRS